MKRRLFLQGLLGTAIAAPVMAKVLKEEPIKFDGVLLYNEETGKPIAGSGIFEETVTPCDEDGATRYISNMYRKSINTD